MADSLTKEKWYQKKTFWGIAGAVLMQGLRTIHGLSGIDPTLTFFRDVFLALAGYGGVEVIRSAGKALITNGIKVNKP